MKQEFIKDVIQAMLPFLNNAQNEKLQEVLQYTLAKYEVTENKNQENNSEQNYVELFLSAKRIEGCSEKSLKYYKATIEAMIDGLNKDIKHIITDDIRGYLTEYQEKKKSILTSSGEYTIFEFNNQKIRFATSDRLEKYTRIVEWDKRGRVCTHSKPYC